MAPVDDDPRTTPADPGTGSSPAPAEPLRPGSYVALAAGGLLVSIGLLLFMVFQADRIVASGLDHRVFYVLLVPLGLAAGAFAFGAMRSTAAFSGKVGAHEVRVTGPAVFAALVVVGGFFLVPAGGGASTVVVRVHGDEDGDPGVAGASVVVDAGQSRLTGVTDASGQAVFAGLGREAVAAGLVVAVTADGYEAVRRTLDGPPAGGVVDIALTARPLVITGTVLDRATRRPLEGVVLDFGSGIATDTTDARGNFRVELPRATGSRVMVLGERDGRVGVDTEVPVESAAPVTLLFGE